MSLTLAGKNVAILAANGFDENQMTEIQRALTKAKVTIRTISPEQGVVNGWQGDGWGHYFPVDVQINAALGSDFDMLVLPGGERSVKKSGEGAVTDAAEIGRRLGEALLLDGARDILEQTHGTPERDCAV